MHLVDAVTALLNGEVTPAMVNAKHNVPRTTAARYQRDVELRFPNLPKDSAESMQVRRAVIGFVFGSSYPDRLPYTEFERREALYQVATGAVKMPAATGRFGVPNQTIKNDMTQLRMRLKLETNEQVRDFGANPATQPVLLARCRDMVIPKAGAARVMNPVVLELFQEIARLHDETGYGWDRRMMSSKAQTLVREMGEEQLQTAQTEEERAVAQRMIDSKCGSRWLERNILVPDIEVFTKKSDLSQKRTAAANPLLDFIMRSEIDEVYERHFREGILKTRRPRADQIWNGDEIGIAPNGKFRKTFSGRRPRGQRGFRTVTGEKNPFWTTLFFFTRADGARLVPPMVIHQGGTATHMPSSVATDLPDDWGVHCTPSGYMDRNGVRVLCERFVKYSGACAENPQYLYWDGHDSHWDPDALDYFAEHHVHVHFLKANDSSNDQPNDMGPNRNIKAIYATCYSEWRARYPGVVYTAEWLNGVLAETYRRFMLSANSEACVRDSFAKAGLYPFRSPSEVIDLATATAEELDFLAKVSRCAKVSQLQVNGGEPARKKLRVVMETGQAPSSPSASGPTPDVPAPSPPPRPPRMVAVVTVSFVTEEQAEVMARDCLPPPADAEARTLFVQAAAGHFFQESFVAPAQDILDKMDSHRAARKIKVKKNAAGCLKVVATNPNTTTGLAVSQEVRIQARSAQDARNAKAEEASAKKAAGKAKEQAAGLEACEAAAALVERARAGQDWAKLSVPTLKLAFKGLGGGKALLKGTKKGDLVAALTPLLATKMAGSVALAGGAAGGAAGAGAGAAEGAGTADDEDSSSDSGDSEQENGGGDMDVDDDEEDM